MSDELRYRSPVDARGFTLLHNCILYDTRISDGAARTYLILLHHARQDVSCFPGQDLLAEERGVAVSSIRRHLCELEGVGLITREQRGRRLTNVYWIEPISDVYRDPSSARSSDRSKTSDHSAGDRSKTSGPLEEEVISKNKKTTLNVGEGSIYKSAQEIMGARVEEIITLTGDERSRKRFKQLLDLAWKNGAGDDWDEALRATRKRLPELEKPGAYFCQALANLLTERGVSVPVGERQERAAVKAEIAASLGMGELTNESTRN